MTAGLLGKVMNRPVPPPPICSAYSADREQREMLPEHLGLKEGVA